MAPPWRCGWMSRATEGGCGASRCGACPELHTKAACMFLNLARLEFACSTAATNLATTLHGWLLHQQHFVASPRPLDFWHVEFQLGLAGMRLALVPAAPSEFRIKLGLACKHSHVQCHGWPVLSPKPPSRLARDKGMFGGRHSEKNPTAFL